MRKKIKLSAKKAQELKTIIDIRWLFGCLIFLVLWIIALAQQNILLSCVFGFGGLIYMYIFNFIPIVQAINRVARGIDKNNDN